MQKNLKSLSYFITVGLMMSLHGCKHTKSGRQSEINPRVEVNTDAPDAAAVSAGGDKQAPAIEAEGMPNPRVPVDLNPPGLPVAQLWSSGAKSFTIHHSIPVKACPEDADAPASAVLLKSKIWSYSQPRPKK
ncbi:MAG: hypothetical protein NTX25_13925 [Proteobacteria bacterium]|nr:hypothetical protein [Pseudomonadota bacterium]